MLCQSCEKKKATTHIKTILNGELKEFNLCSDCAVKLGYGSFFGNIGLDLDKLFGSFMESFGEEGSSKRCNFCGSSFEDIAKSGKVGCSHCYETFYDELLPSIQRIHGRTTHAGKLARSAGTEVRIKNELTQLKYEIEQAIKTQEFEKAAELRDRIRELEKSMREHSESANGKEGS
ncbi:MAG: UvrB/UvrC motif-containing protein [Clostridia bacterium]|nr:UvrB/UvrC motif-containing protein [Clostridia bacterium]